MSFPPEIQGSVRAQLADCLIGVVCQRLTYQPGPQILVPHCEVLVSNSGVKSHIRTGQFGQIATSLQTGRDDGMWSFERYQRWIEQKKDWIKPSQAAPIEDLKTAAPSLGHIPARPQTSMTSPTGPSHALGRRAETNPGIAKPHTKPASDGRIEIDITDSDLELEELGKKIAQKESDQDSED
jgi:twitching motility protein PilT